MFLTALMPPENQDNGFPLRLQYSWMGSVSVSYFVSAAVTQYYLFRYLCVLALHSVAVPPAQRACEV